MCKLLYILHIALLEHLTDRTRTLPLPYNLTEWRIKSTRASFDEVFAGRPQARILVEASTESEWVASHLEGLGHEVIVADPNFAPMYATRDKKIKIDKRGTLVRCAKPVGSEPIVRRIALQNVSARSERNS